MKKLTPEKVKKLAASPSFYIVTNEDGEPEVRGRTLEEHNEWVAMSTLERFGRLLMTERFREWYDSL